MAKKSIRVSHIGIPGDLSVLKLKSYPRSALAEAAQGTGDNEDDACYVGGANSAFRMNTF